MRGGEGGEKPSSGAGGKGAGVSKGGRVGMSRLIVGVTIETAVSTIDASIDSCWAEAKEAGDGRANDSSGADTTIPGPKEFGSDARAREPASEPTPKPTPVPIRDAMAPRASKASSLEYGAGSSSLRRSRIGCDKSANELGIELGIEPWSTSITSGIRPRRSQCCTARAGGIVSAKLSTPPAIELDSRFRTSFRPMSGIDAGMLLGMSSPRPSEG